jgi:hypothetical protein
MSNDIESMPPELAEIEALKTQVEIEREKHEYDWEKRIIALENAQKEQAREMARKHEQLAQRMERELAEMRRSNVATRPMDCPDDRRFQPPGGGLHA